MKIKKLITCDNLTEAYLIKGRLANEEIISFLTNQNFTTLMPLYNNILGAGIQVLVNEKDFEKAREIIKDKLEPDNTKLVCPYCGSTDIKLGFGKNRWFKILNIILAIIAFFPIGNIKPKYYCNNCKSEIK